MTLQQIIKEVFDSNEKNEVLELLKTNGFDEDLKKSIKLLNTFLKQENEPLSKTTKGQFYHIATIMLIQLNERLRKIPVDKTEIKQKLEGVLSEISKRILQKVITNYDDEEKSIILVQLVRVLKDICEFYSYKINDLLKLLGVDEINYFKSNIEKKGDDLYLPSTKQDSLPYYTWHGKETELDTFISYLVDELIICTDKSKLKALFSPINENMNIEFNQTDPDNVLKFLCCLKDSGLVRTKGNGKQGFYTVLKVHVKNFDEIFLRFNEANKVVDRVKKHADFVPTKDIYNNDLKKFIK